MWGRKEDSGFQFHPVLIPILQMLLMPMAFLPHDDPQLVITKFLVSWLGAMGVDHFTTLVPSDLEYDPRLGAVAEWRDVSTLRQHRFDKVTIEALLEGADNGDRLGYAWYYLPAARLLKAWSVGQGLLGGVPTIPAGMSAATALRVDALANRIHPEIAAAIEEKAAAFRAENGYEAPYWVLFEMAREALEENRSRLAPALYRP